MNDEGRWARWCAGAMCVALLGPIGSCGARARGDCTTARVTSVAAVRTADTSGGRYCFSLVVEDAGTPLLFGLDLERNGRGDDAGASDDDASAEGVGPSMPFLWADAGTATYALVASPPGVAFQTVCGAPRSARVMPNSDDQTMNIPAPGAAPLPFAMRMFGVTSPGSLTLCTNGWLSLRPDEDMGDLSGTVPATDAPNLLIAAYWTDLVTRNGICYATVGAAPQRRFVVEWDDMREFGGQNAHATFQVVIHEIVAPRTHNVIDVIYQRLDQLSRQGVAAGIENTDGTSGVIIPPPFTPRAVRFVPSS